MNKKTILIFDDDEDILEACNIILSGHGYAVKTQKNCEAIIEKINNALPDLILMDNQILPNGGIVAARTIAASSLHRHIPIIYFSANINVAGLAAAAGAQYFIEKPFDIDELAKIAEKAINEHPVHR